MGAVGGRGTLNNFGGWERQYSSPFQDGLPMASFLIAGNILVIICVVMPKHEIRMIM